MASIPGLAIPQQNRQPPSQRRVEKLTADLQALAATTSTTVPVGEAFIPAFQRQGYLEKLGHNKNKWFKRFFVLRDSFLLSYNLQKSDFTTEPRSCIHLGNCKMVETDAHNRDFVFAIITETGDEFTFSASSDNDKRAWLDDISTARQVTHANMVKVAVENQCLAEETGVGNVAREQSTSALALFSNPAYVQETPLTGGMEGWLSTNGFNFEGNAAATTWNRNYFMLRDSHLLMFNAGDILSKPRGVMYLVGSQVDLIPEDSGLPHRFLVRSPLCGDLIELASSSEKSRKRWVRALQVGSRVTFPDFTLLEKERQVLANQVLTPRAPTPRGPGGKLVTRDAPSVLEEETDLMGAPLAPGAVQPYDADGVPLLRNPKGELINPNTNEVVPANVPRFSDLGEPLDSFNRPLPPDAVSMFDQTGQPIGVGPDGQHYTADGEVVDKFTPHFDAGGTQISQETVNAADQVAPTISVAVKVRAALKGEDTAAETVDPLGRTFKAHGDDVMVTEDGQEVPTTARRVEVDGKLLTYEEASKLENVSQQQEVTSGTLTIKEEVGNESGVVEVELGTVEVDSICTLNQVRATIMAEMGKTDFAFLIEGVPLTKVEERAKLAMKYLPEIFVRGTELNTDSKKAKFTSKVAQLASAQAQKEQEQAEFLNMMNKVRNKNFLNPVGRDLTK